MTRDEAVNIYELAVKAYACKGNITKAKEYLDKGDIEGFERICRGNYVWFNEKSIPYELTDGEGESWYDDCQLWMKCNYLNRKLHGLREEWYTDCQLESKENYLNGELHGLCELLDNDGVKLYTINYINGELVEEILYD